MKTYPLGDLTEAQLLEVVSLNEKGTADYPWLDVSEISISADEQADINKIQTRLARSQTTLINEATIWARGIYPLLILAERDQIEAWAEVSLSSMFVDVKLTGTADGVIAKVIAGIMRTPYLVTLEAKRSIEAKHPRIQFYGQLLVAAKLNWQAQTQSSPDSSMEIFGCYTIGDVWTFARATVDGIDKDSGKPLMTVETSREYVERVEAATILKILKKIIAHYQE
ncbi:MAG: hypothetical protein AAF639_42110 [Chloroflexota bacterium]